DERPANRFSSSARLAAESSVLDFIFALLHNSNSHLYFSVQSLCSLCLCGVFVLEIHQPRRHREHRGCTEKSPNSHSFCKSCSASSSLRSSSCSISNSLIASLNSNTVGFQNRTRSGSSIPKARQTREMSRVARIESPPNAKKSS